MIKIELTNDILNVLPLIKVSKIDETDNGAQVKDLDLFYGGTVTENIIRSWGKYDEHLPGTELREEGRLWDTELEEKAWNTYQYIVDNISDIISVLFYYSGSKVEEGIYMRKKRMPGIWQYEPFKK